MRGVFAFVLMVLAAFPLWAEENIIAGLSQNRVSITTTFVGSEILIFGAVKREVAVPEGTLDVVVVVEGPGSEITVRKKDKRAGIWINTEAAVLRDVPSFYAIETSRSFSDIVPIEVDRAQRISVPNVIGVSENVGALGEAEVAAFRDAVVRIRSDAGLYAVDEGGVSLSEATLFETRVQLPSNLTEGDYNARIYLMRGGAVVAQHVAQIDVRKVGLERWLYMLAHEHSLIYAFMSLAIAIAAGWGASAAFRMILRS